MGSRAGSAARVRLWWARLVAGETGAPPELLEKIRLLEGVLPLLRVVPGLGGVLGGARTVADLLPQEDEAMGAVLEAVHGWSGRMLEPEEPAPGGTPGADSSVPALPGERGGERNESRAESTGPENADWEAAPPAAAADGGPALGPSQGDGPLIRQESEVPTKRHHYNSESVASALEVYERHFGMDSELFYARYGAHDLPDGLPRSLASAWAGLYEELLELRAVDELHAARAREWILRALGQTFLLREGAAAHVHPLPPEPLREAEAMLRQAARLLDFGNGRPPEPAPKPGDVEILRRHAR